MRKSRADPLFRTVALVLIAMLLAAGAFAEPAASRPYTQGLLWQVESAGAAPSYVFGTVHLADPRVTALPAPVRERFDAARGFTMEVTLEAANIVLLAKRMIDTDGRDLSSVIGPALFEKVAAAAPALGVPPGLLPMFRPWAIALLLMVPPEDPEKILDQQLYRRALAQMKTVHELETVDEQVRVFEGLGAEDEIALLRHALESRARRPETLERLITAYLERDLAALMRISEEDRGDAAARRLGRTLRERLLDERNVRMAARMEPHVRAGGAFIAVGALHLYGERGVLARLESRGFRLNRVY
jgi:uncharacterized protein